MNGTPAGWYDDPENPGQQRYWDGSAWTEHRASGAESPAPPPADAAAPTPPPTTAPGMTPPPPPGSPVGAPGGAPLPPPAAPATTSPKTSRKGLWIVLSILGVLVVLVILAIAAVTLLGDSATNTLEENLPKELESTFASQGLEVTITKAECDKVSTDDGPFTADCTLTIANSSRPLTVTVDGTISGSTLYVTSADSDTNLINEALAVQAAQNLVDARDPGYEVTGCTLSEPIVVLQDGDTFTCALDSGQTVTFVSNDNTLDIESVS